MGLKDFFKGKKERAKERAEALADQYAVQKELQKAGGKARKKWARVEAKRIAESRYKVAKESAKPKSFASSVDSFVFGGDTSVRSTGELSGDIGDLMLGSDVGFKKPTKSKKRKSKTKTTTIVVDGKEITIKQKKRKRRKKRTSQSGGFDSDFDFLM
jgi:hypothetical protein